MRAGLNGSNRTCEKSRSVRQVSKLACVPRQSRSARTTRIYKRRGETMLSDFPRLGFDPFAELRRMQSEMNRVFGGFTTATAREFPSINIWLGENSVVVTAELAGVTANDVNLNLQEDVLTLGGKREPKTQQENINWQRRRAGVRDFLARRPTTL